jgi:hypothetical protein
MLLSRVRGRITLEKEESYYERVPVDNSGLFCRVWLVRFWSIRPVSTISFVSHKAFLPDTADPDLNVPPNPALVLNLYLEIWCQ